MKNNKPKPDHQVEKNTPSNISHQDYEKLCRENAKLKKINNVLMQRVEMGWGNHSVAYNSFESAALLTDKVKERTLKLQRTLYRLEETNNQLELAQSESEQARQLLVDAIESISDPFVLFDKERRILLANSPFYEFWDVSSHTFKVGVSTLQDIVNYAKAMTLIDQKSKLYQGMDKNADTQSKVIFRLNSGRWIQMSERPTQEGGLVLVYTDVTAIKQAEQMRYEQTVAEQALILQSTLENMSEGVALVNEEMKLEAWNRRFIELADLDGESVKQGDDFRKLLSNSELNDLQEQEHLASYDRSAGVYEYEKTKENGCVLVIKRHVIARGGFLNTYTDITERSKNEEALRESEKRIRLITNAMPAQIYYVNKEMRYEFANSFFEEWFDCPSSEILGKHLRDVLGEAEFNNHKLYVERALCGHVVSFELEQSNKIYKNRISHKTYIPHFDIDNVVIGFFALEQDVSEQRRTAKELQHAYQYMEQRVDDRTKKISEMNKLLVNEITERRKVQASLVEAKLEADRANNSKTKFLAATSHDLLQPINAARLFSSALMEQDLSRESRELTNSLSYSLDDVELLITSLVDISKLEAGLIESVPSTFIINDLLSNLAKEFKPQAEKNGLKFRYSMSNTTVRTDSQLVARILRNFLSNAIRNTLKGEILFGSRRRKDGLEIQVLDTGIGIAEDNIREIFQEFKRFTVKEKFNDKGLGLGLAIVDKLSTVLDHAINVSSTLGKGSCFSVTVPYCNDAVQETDDSGFNVDVLSNSIQGARVLVIDNDVEICKAMQLLLSAWGCEIETVQSMEDIRDRDEAIKKNPPQLILADYHLDNGRTGIEVVEMLNASLDDDVPVIMITADYTNELRQQLKEKGYVLLHKPLKTLKLKVAMANLLS